MPDPKQDSFPKQIENTIVNVLIILAVGPIAFLGLEWVSGDFNVNSPHVWQAMFSTLSRGLVISVLMACAWIGMKSPLGKRFRLLASSVHTDADGAQQEMKVALDQPMLPPEQTRTTEIDPKTQKVTITETPTPPAEKKEGE